MPAKESEIVAGKVLFIGNDISNWILGTSLAERIWYWSAAFLWHMWCKSRWRSKKVFATSLVLSNSRTRHINTGGIGVKARSTRQIKVLTHICYMFLLICWALAKA